MIGAVRSGDNSPTTTRREPPVSPACSVRIASPEPKAETSNTASVSPAGISTAPRTCATPGSVLVTATGVAESAGADNSPTLNTPLPFGASTTCPSVGNERTATPTGGAVISKLRPAAAAGPTNSATPTSECVVLATNEVPQPASPRSAGAIDTGNTQLSPALPPVTGTTSSVSPAGILKTLAGTLATLGSAMRISTARSSLREVAVKNRSVRVSPKAKPCMLEATCSCAATVTVTVSRASSRPAPSRAMAATMTCWMPAVLGNP